MPNTSHGKLANELAAVTSIRNQYQHTTSRGHHGAPFLPPPPYQVTVEYRDNMGAMEPLRVHTVVISVHHGPDVGLEEIRRSLMEKVVRVVIPARYLDERTVYHLLPSGKFLSGGPQVGERLLWGPFNCRH